MRNKGECACATVCDLIIERGKKDAGQREGECVEAYGSINLTGSWL